MTTAKLPAIGATIWIKIRGVRIVEAKVESDANGKLHVLGHDGLTYLREAWEEGEYWWSADPRVKPAEAPREQSPELAEAEIAPLKDAKGAVLKEALRILRDPSLVCVQLTDVERKLIAAELDRRASEIVRLTAIAEHCRQCGVKFDKPDVGPLCVACEGGSETELKRLRKFVRKVRDADENCLTPDELDEALTQALEALDAESTPPQSDDRATKETP